jgi:hypothetical protein
MMGGYLLYSNDVLFGGIYSDRLLVKIVPENEKYGMAEVVPYDGSKKLMYFMEDIDDKEKLAESLSEEQLFTKGMYPWVGGSVLGSYFVSCLSSHYDWAMKKLKAHKKNCS